MPLESCMENQCKIFAKMMGNGKITVPKEVREVLDLKDGDLIGAIVWKVDLSVPKEDIKRG